MAIPDNLKRAYPTLLLGAYTLFMCGYFFMAHYSDHYRLFGRFVFLIGLFVFLAGLRDNRRHPLLLAVAAYMLYLLASGFWSEPPDWYKLWQRATICLYLLGFFAITRYLAHHDSARFEWALRVCVGVAAVAAAVSMVTFYADHPFPGTRLEGIGSLTNVNEFAVVYGVYGLLALGFALDTDNGSLRLALFGAVAVFIAFAWFGQSRTTLAALAIALGTMAALTLERRRALAVTLGLLAGLGAALAVFFPDPVQGALERGAGLRPGIWSAVWREALEHPVAGHGLVTQLAVQSGGQTFENAHGAYLQVFWQGGVIGLALFLWLFAVGLAHAWQLGRREGNYSAFCILLFAALVMTTDLDTLIERPREQWMLFWFPLALVLARRDLPRRTTR